MSVKHFHAAVVFVIHDVSGKWHVLYEINRGLYEKMFYWPLAGNRSKRLCIAVLLHGIHILMGITASHFLPFQKQIYLFILQGL